jgi:hypothetical protein
MTNLNLYAWSGKLLPLPRFVAKADKDDDGEMSVGGDTCSESVYRQPKLSERQAQARIRLNREFLQTRTMSSYLNTTMRTARNGACAMFQMITSIEFDANSMPYLERKHEWFCYMMTFLFARSIMLFQAWKRSGDKQLHTLTVLGNRGPKAVGFPELRRKSLRVTHKACIRLMCSCWSAEVHLRLC